MLRNLVKKEQHSRIFSPSYDNAIMKRVLATHAPDGREVDLEPLIGVTEEIFRHAVPRDIDPVITGAQSENIHALPKKDKHALLGFDDIKGNSNGLANIIHTISCEYSCICSSGADAHASAMAILNMLSSYTWEAKVVISLAAFAINFGEFWLVAQLFATTNPLAKSIALLKHMPNVIENYKLLKDRFDAINILIKDMLDVTKCIMTFKNLPHQYIQDDQPPKSTATSYIPTAIYWSVKSMVACTTQLTSLLGMNYDTYITATSEASELSILTQKVHNSHEHLRSILVLCYQNIEEKQQREYNLTRVRIIETQHGEQTSKSTQNIAMAHQTRKDVNSHQEISTSPISHRTDERVGSHKEISGSLMSHQTHEDVESHKEISPSLISHQTEEHVGSHKEIPGSLKSHQTHEDVGSHKELSPSLISHQTCEDVGSHNELSASLILHQNRKDGGSRKEIPTLIIPHQTRKDVESNNEISTSLISHRSHEDVRFHKEISTLISHQTLADFRSHKDILSSIISHQTREDVRSHKVISASVISHQTSVDVRSRKEISLNLHQTREEVEPHRETLTLISDQTRKDGGSHKEIPTSRISHQTRENVGSHKEISATQISDQTRKDARSHKDKSTSSISHGQSKQHRDNC